MERRTLANGLVFAALVCFGSFLWAGIASAQEDNVVQGQNGSTASAAASSPAVAGNATTFQAGPGATGIAAPAQAQQNGDNVGSEHQVAEAKSGDASAGSQITGAAGGGATVQKQNSSAGAVAVSSPAVAVNVGQTRLGPQATAVLAPTQTSQTGSNRYDGTQEAIAHSGDAVAGSQVTGIAGVGDHTVQGSNASFNPVAVSGPVVAINVGSTTTGPSALGILAPGSASQLGSNDAVFVQANEAKSGDAVAGGQVTGIVGGGTSRTQNQSNSAFPRAASGAVVSVNLTAPTTIGPNAIALGNTAQASQLGDNAAEIGQSVEAASGDAVAGGQVTGIVGDVAGHVEVQNQQTSIADIAVSGTVGPVLNVVAQSSVGPQAIAIAQPASVTQSGSNALTIAQDTVAETGDALAGAQVTGVVGGGDVTVQNQNTSILGIAISGPVAGIGNLAVGVGVGPQALALAAPASASQLGGNAVEIGQGAMLASGDAIAGSQVSGVVEDPSEVTIQNSNASFASFSFSGPVVTGAANVATGVTGPRAAALAAPAQTSQAGSNVASTHQGADLASGDAVAGSQVTGAVSDDGGATVQNQSSSTLAIAVSGPVAPAVVNLASTGVGPTALALGNVSSTSQIGGNRLAVDQHAVVHSGDAVAGGQVTGIVTSGGHVTVSNQNSSAGAISLSGPAGVGSILNVALNAQVGPQALAVLAPAQASQQGTNRTQIAQEVVASSGDAVSGAQVSGVVTGSGDVTVQNSNATTATLSVSGPAAVGTIANGLIGLQAGPRAIALGAPASASQLGGSRISIGQGVEASSGDAVAGAQVTGTVNGSGDVTVQAMNNATVAIAITGPATGNNFVVNVAAGAQAAALVAPAQASQAGAAALDVVQIADASTGDAVSGAQVVGSAQDDATVQIQNFGIVSLGVTTQANANNIATGNVGAVATALGAPASTSHLGASATSAEQIADAHTGDAVSSGQVTGVAGFGDGSLASGASLSPATTGDGAFEITTAATL